MYLLHNYLRNSIFNMPYLIDITNSSLDYLPIAIQLIFVIGFIATMLALSALVGPKRKTKDKLETFASGIAHHGDAREPIAVKYFLVAILFVLFDVEVIFFYPYAVNFKAFALNSALAWKTFMAVLMFVGFFVVGFIYIIKKGALNWED